ncbi:hypothetical protein BGX38DRAFT_1206829 [Terfezia claveryi]|nr:hypothetical protein BGX38DRAFT_1206829 [Terfezia claveryi]
MASPRGGLCLPWLLLYVYISESTGMKTIFNQDTKHRNNNGGFIEDAKGDSEFVLGLGAESLVQQDVYRGMMTIADAE